MSKKIAGNPIPIDSSVVREITDDFLQNFINILIDNELDPMTWLVNRKKYSSQVYDQLFFKTFDYKHFDISGAKTLTHIIIALNPHQSKTQTLTEIIPLDIVKERFGNDVERVNILRVMFADDHIKRWEQQLAKAQLLDSSLYSDLNSALIDVMNHDFYTIIAHELSHAVDVVGSSKRLRNEYEKVLDIGPQSTQEEVEAAASFYYTTREEIKAHINETIYEIDDYISKFGPESLYGRDFLQFLEKHSSTFNNLRYYLTVRPGDEDIKSLGGSIAKRKRAAWKTYLKALHSWWEKMMEKLQEYLESDISARGQRRLARFIRGKVLAKTITKVV